MIANYDGFQFVTHADFYQSILNGKSEPYQGDMNVVKYYLGLFPNKNRTYIDVGAHIGVTVCAYSRMFDKVVGYEPTFENYDMLRQNVDNNKLNHVSIYNVGLYNEECVGNVYKYEENNSGTFYFKKEEGGSIQCRELDKECEKYGIRDIDFIKLDTEGCELLVLQGARKTIEEWKPLIEIEMNGLSERVYNIQAKEVTDFLSELGYSLFADRGANLFFFVDESRTS
jgi:FkbM family methyltransferase